MVQRKVDTKQLYLDSFKNRKSHNQRVAENHAANRQKGVDAFNAKGGDPNRRTGTLDSQKPLDEISLKYGGYSLVSKDGSLSGAEKLAKQNGASTKPKYTGAGNPNAAPPSDPRSVDRTDLNGNPILSLGTKISSENPNQLSPDAFKKEFAEVSSEDGQARQFQAEIDAIRNIPGFNDFYKTGDEAARKQNALSVLNRVTKSPLSIDGRAARISDATFSDYDRSFSEFVTPERPQPIWGEEGAIIGWSGSTGDSTLDGLYKTIKTAQIRGGDAADAKRQVSDYMSTILNPAIVEEIDKNTEIRTGEIELINDNQSAAQSSQTEASPGEVGLGDSRADELFNQKIELSRRKLASSKESKDKELKEDRDKLLADIEEQRKEELANEYNLAAANGQFDIGAAGQVRDDVENLKKEIKDQVAERYAKQVESVNESYQKSKQALDELVAEQEFAIEELILNRAIEQESAAAAAAADQAKFERSQQATIDKENRAEARKREAAALDEANITPDEILTALGKIDNMDSEFGAIAVRSFANSLYSAEEAGTLAEGSTEFFLTQTETGLALKKQLEELDLKKQQQDAEKRERDLKKNLSKGMSSSDAKKAADEAARERQIKASAALLDYQTIEDGLTEGNAAQKAFYQDVKDYQLSDPEYSPEKVEQNRAELGIDALSSIPVHIIKQYEQMQGGVTPAASNAASTVPAASGGTDLLNDDFNSIFGQ